MNDICFLTTLVFYMMNVITFGLYGYDKHQAYYCKWRIPEVVLLGFTILLGSIGSLLGMKLFRHKTKKKKFRIISWISLPVSLILVFLIYLFCRQI